MTQVMSTSNGRKEVESAPISSLTVEGFKSICDETTIEFRPLTILAGANSSGKSSAIQPLLLLKQTLESSYDPGPLLLNGPNVRFTSAAQLLCRNREGVRQGEFSVGIAAHRREQCRLFFRKQTDSPLELESVSFGSDKRYREGTYDIQTTNPFAGERFAKAIEALRPKWVTLRRHRWAFEIVLKQKADEQGEAHLISPLGWLFEGLISRVIHVPGLRGNPQRTYPVTAIGDHFPGTFEDYVASVIHAAQRIGDQPFLRQLARDLRDLGLTWTVRASAVDDARVELQVGRLPKPIPGGEGDLINIADVGFGVSQTLPVVVALLVAKPGQMVYIEQPEIHLHPRAQHAMAGLLARAANRGVQVVVETHSSILLLGVQNLVARGDLDPAKVKLHWFQRDEQTGLTSITTADLDAAGSFGPWPEDFDDVTLAAQQEYLDAAEKKLAP